MRNRRTREEKVEAGETHKPERRTEKIPLSGSQVNKIGLEEAIIEASSIVSIKANYDDEQWE